MTTESIPQKQRLAKTIAQAGICSRRDAEKLILQKRVLVNDQMVETPATLVGEEDQISVNGLLLPVQPTLRLWRYYKPSGLITTHKDPQGRKTVFETLPPDMQRVISVGRLDLISEGLMLLTNQGGFARQLELPTTHLKRIYKVRLFGRVDAQRLQDLKHGITIDGIYYDRIDAQVLREQTSNCWLKVCLTEGKNREIRRVFTHLGYHVNRLIRLQYGPFKLAEMDPGEIQEVPSEIFHSFKSDLKI